MALTKRSPLLVIAILWLSLILFNGVESADLSNLRRTRNNGTNGRFVVPRQYLEDELQRIGLNGRVQLLSSTKPNSDFEGEVSVVIQTAIDMTLHEELPSRMEDFTVDGTFLVIGLPVVDSGGSHSVIMLAYFSDAPSPFLSAYLTSVQAVHHIDSIEVGDGFVTLKDGCDVMHIEVSNNEDCSDDENVGADFDHVTGKDMRFSNFPAGFDWGCDILGDHISFCKKLKPYVNLIYDVGGDVCTASSTGESKRCSSNMRVNTMTGVFRDALPFFADMVPIESFEAEWIEREHGMGIVFPCF